MHPPIHDRQSPKSEDAQAVPPLAPRSDALDFTLEPAAVRPHTAWPGTVAAIALVAVVASILNIAIYSGARQRLVEEGWRTFAAGVGDLQSDIESWIGRLG